MGHVPLSGDEGNFFKNGALLHAWLFHGKPFPDLIGAGWFMPGAAFLSCILHCFSDSLMFHRLALFLINFALFSVIFLKLKRAGHLLAAALFFIASLFPYVLPFMFTYWMELLATKVLVLACMLLSEIRFDSAGFRRLCAQCVVIGVLLGAAIYLRSNSILAIPIVFILGAALAVKDAPRTQYLTACLSALVAPLLAIALLLPWTVAISSAFNTTVITTTNVDLAIIGNYMEQAEFEAMDKLATHPGKNIWLNQMRRAKERGISIVELNKETRRDVLAKLTAPVFFSRLKRALKNYFLDQNQFLGRFLTNYEQQGSGPVQGVGPAASGLFLGLNTLSYSLFMLAFVVAALTPAIGRDDRTKALILATKGLIFLCFMQPFIHWSHGRYVATVIPVGAILIGLVVESRRARVSSRGRGGSAFNALCWAGYLGLALLLMFFAAVAVFSL